MSDHTKQDLYNKVQDVISKEDFYHMVQEEIENFGGLIDETTAALVVMDKLDPHCFSNTTIASLKEGSDATLYAVVDYIGNIRTFDRGRVVNIIVGDATGRCVLVLWDANVGLAEDGQMKPGIVIKIINGYVKDGFYGLEINIGRWGLVDLTLANPPNITYYNSVTPLLKATRGVVDVIVTVHDIKPTQIYITQRGESFAAQLEAIDESGERGITLWNQMARSIQCYQPGDKLHLSRIYVKQGCLHGGDFSEIRLALSDDTTSSP